MQNQAVCHHVRTRTVNTKMTSAKCMTSAGEIRPYPSRYLATTGLCLLGILAASTSSSFDDDHSCTSLPDGYLRVRGANERQDASRLEICHSGTWGIVCGTKWTNRSARVACAQLGFANGTRLLPKELNRDTLNISYTPPSNETKLWLDNVICIGTERTLLDCRQGNRTGTLVKTRFEGVTCTSIKKAAGVFCQDLLPEGWWLPQARWKRCLSPEIEDKPGKQANKSDAPVVVFAVFFGISLAVNLTIFAHLYRIRSTAKSRNQRRLSTALNNDDSISRLQNNIHTNSRQAVGCDSHPPKPTVQGHMDEEDTESLRACNAALHHYDVPRPAKPANIAVNQRYLSVIDAVNEVAAAI